MTIPPGNWLRSSLLAIVIVFNACEPETSDDAIPYVPFSPIVINLLLPEFQALKTTGFKYVDGGVRGIIVVKATSGQFIAYERNCSYHPNDACATVEMDASNLFMVDPCCKSTFELQTGNAAGGPAWRPLRQYETFLNGNELTITDIVIN